MRPAYRVHLLTTVAALGIAAGMLAAPTTASRGAELEPVSIARSATDLPPPLARREAQTFKVEFETIEIVGKLDEGTSFRYWTFNGKVPGPMIRVRVGDTVDVTMRNHPDSWLQHNVDFHAVTGPGGGGAATIADPGQYGGFTFKALHPGLYVYHCATAPVAQHIANGMYGLILVEQEQGLPPVDREFYVMQGEIYTEEPFGSTGELTDSYDKLMAEQPEYYVLNGSVEGLKTEAPLYAKVGETVRIFFGVGGPNKTSSFHVIGEIFDKVYDLGSVTGPVTPDVQTVMVAPGGAVVAELSLQVPGRYLLVDHALSRAARGLAGFLEVDGPAAPDIFRAEGAVQTMAEH